MKKCNNLDTLGDKAYDLNLSGYKYIGHNDSNQRELEEYSDNSVSKETLNHEFKSKNN